LGKEIIKDGDKTKLYQNGWSTKKAARPTRGFGIISACWYGQWLCGRQTDLFNAL